MESNREFNGGRLFVAEQLFRLHRAEYEALFGAMPPLDDATRFPALDARDRRLRRGGHAEGLDVRVPRACPGDGADYDGMAPADQTLVTTVAVNGAKAIAAYVRQLRCGAGRFDRWLDGDAAALDAQRAARRGAVRRARELRLLPRGPAPDRRRVPQRGPPPGHGRRRDPATSTIAAPRRASPPRSPIR